MLVAIAVIAALIGLLLPAVQSAREAARRTTCANNLHNQALALATYHAGHMHLPPGRNSGRQSPTGPILGFSWAAYLLPYLEQAPVFRETQYQAPWNSPLNQSAIATRIALFECPSTESILLGESDYGGVSGTAIGAVGMEANAAIEDVDVRLADWSKILNRGVLIPCDSVAEGIRFNQITDGLSRTLAIAESPVSSDLDEKYWA
ncbi:MAG: DUF1559 domain-containing protein, partial [Planctomycetales bacterium]|nr:DUF1559 domain-containing protein [Planctomycetales bacterium]